MIPKDITGDGQARGNSGIFWLTLAMNTTDTNYKSWIVMRIKPTSTDKILLSTNKKSHSKTPVKSPENGNPMTSYGRRRDLTKTENCYRQLISQFS